MSYSLKYYPDPGIAFDITKMLFVKLNSEVIWKEFLTSFAPHINEIEYIKKHADLLPDPEGELLLFSCIPANKSSTFLSTIVAKLISCDFQQFSISSLDSYFNDICSVKTDLLTYYFGEQNYRYNDLERIIRQNKNIPDKIKLLLFGFIINPNKYISSLSQTIHSYFHLIKEWLLSEQISESIFYSFIELLIEKNNIKSIDRNIIISYSLCISTPDFLCYNFNSESPFFISTLETVKQLLDNTDSPYFTSLISGATALNDKHRISIITLLISSPKLTLQEISAKLGLSLSATNHHLSVLRKANIVTGVRYNRNIIYSYAPEGFQYIIEILQKIMKGEHLK